MNRRGFCSLLCSLPLVGALFRQVQSATEATVSYDPETGVLKLDLGSHEGRMAAVQLDYFCLSHDGGRASFELRIRQIKPFAERSAIEVRSNGCDFATAPGEGLMLNLA